MSSKTTNSKNKTNRHSLVNFPEEIDEKNHIKVYGETSYENQIAVLSHYLHNSSEKLSKKRKEEIVGAIREFLERKQSRQKLFIEELTDEDIWAAAESPTQYNLFEEFFNVPFPGPKEPRFTFIDLFAGIGGFRIAMQNLGGKCVYSSEFDVKAQESYLANYGEMPFGDITKPTTKQYIPKKFDVLCAGFPCQAFSLAGKRLGFKDETRGTLFFEIEDILRKHQPKAIFLENVKGLAIHDKGRTLKTILEHLDDAGYDVVPPQIVNAMDFGVPQHRERIYILGFKKSLHVDINKFKYPEPQTTGDNRPKFKDVMEKTVPSVKYYLSDVYVETLKRHRSRHEAAGHGFGYEIIDINGVANAIVVGGMGRERNLVIDKRLTDFTPVTNIKGEVNRDGIRRMTPREWARLQGFPDNFRIVVADASAYKQFGNSVAVPAIQATAEKELKMIKLI
ncbi:MAG: DNA (cytosine-5-)-methyltransferase [bacterium F082]|nr:MAG: DNA (cytosine-5-)-methyltransferase [bacterium F082]KWW29601.1 MAG: DNA (cytosine-5-)-methyltransferase [bacterium P201]